MDPDRDELREPVADVLETSPADVVGRATPGAARRRGADQVAGDAR